MSFNGLTPYHNPNLKSGVLIKGGAGKVMGLIVTNSGNAVRYIRLYDKLTAPTLGTTVPALTIAILNGLTQQYFDFAGTGVNEEESGIMFVNGIGAAASTSYADTDASACTDGDVQINVLYR